MPVELGRLNQTHDDRSPLACAQNSSEQPVLAPQGRWAGTVLDPVIVDGYACVGEVMCERPPALEPVVDGGGLRWTLTVIRQVSMRIRTLVHSQADAPAQFGAGHFASVWIERSRKKVNALSFLNTPARSAPWPSRSRRVYAGSAPDHLYPSDQYWSRRARSLLPASRLPDQA